MQGIAPPVPDNGWMPATKSRNIRVDEKLWAAAKAIAKARHEPISAVVRRALVEYVEKHDGSIEER